MITNYPWHEESFSILANMYNTARIPSALLIHGIHNTGKLSLALKFIRLLLCNAPVDKNNNKEPCNICQSCKLLLQDDFGYNDKKPLLIRHSHNEDFIYCQREFNDKKQLTEQILIKQIREFCNALSKTSYKLKIGLLYYGDELRKDSSDSLLKTLEETPNNTIIIILAHKIGKLSKTILSRCQKVHIKNSYDEKTISWLADNIKKYSNIDAKQLLKLNYGAPLEALNMLINDEYNKYLSWQEYLLSIALNANNIIAKMPDNNFMAFRVLRDLLTTMITNKLVNKVDKLTNINDIALKSDINFLVLLLADVEKSIQLQHTNINISLLLHNILIVWSHITHLASYPNIFE